MGDAERADGNGILMTLPDREDAEELAEELLGQGYEPCRVRRDHRHDQGGDDTEDATWVIEIRTGPHGGPAAFEEPHLTSLAADYGGFASVR